MRRRRREIKISVSRKNDDFFSIWDSMRIADRNPSNTIIHWARAAYMQEWKGRNKVLSPPQQKVPEVIKTVVPPPEVIAARQRESEEQRRLANERMRRDLESRIQQLEQTKAIGNEKMIEKAEIKIKKLNEELEKINNE